MFLRFPSYSFQRGDHRFEVHHPHPEYDHEADPCETQLTAFGDEYTLTCSPCSGDEGLKCRFSVGASEWGYVISSRLRSQYERLMPGFALDPTKQLIEVGAGLSEAVVSWADASALHSPRGPKPVVIDPAKYQVMSDMIDAAIALAPQDEFIDGVLPILKQMQYRCRAILDPDRIQLLQCTLKAAHETHPELHGTADAVVDCYAAATYVRVNFCRRNVDSQRKRARANVLALEQSLLKPGGKLFLTVPAHHS